MYQNYPKLGAPIKPKANFQSIPVHNVRFPVDYFSSKVNSFKASSVAHNRKAQSSYRSYRNPSSAHNSTHHHRSAPKVKASIPAELFEITRRQFAILKSQHHIGVLQNSAPKTWLKWADHITNNVHLAFSTEKCKIKIKTVADECIQNLIAASIDHYKSTISDAETYLQEHSHKLGDLFNVSYELIKKWAYKQLGQKLQASVLNEALCTIKTLHASSSASKCTAVAANVVNHSTTVTRACQTEPYDPDDVEIASPVASVHATSIKQTKVTNSSRFFIHSAQIEAENIEAANNSSVNNASIKQVSSDNMNFTDPVNLTPPVNTAAPSIVDNDPLSQGSLSQMSITSFVPNSSQIPKDGITVYKVSTDQMAQLIGQSKNVLLGDENWKDFSYKCVINDLSIFLFSAKVSAFRTLLDKIKGASNVEKLIICFSCNNCDAPSAISLVSNIFKAFSEKFKNATIFVCLIGVCSNLPPNSAKALESLNSILRNKSNKVVLVNPPDNFSTTDGVMFTNDTKEKFYNTLNSFLC